MTNDCILTESRLTSLQRINEMNDWLRVSPVELRDEPNTDYYLQQFTLLHAYPLLQKSVLIPL
jgi:hypothetical protein